MFLRTFSSGFSYIEVWFTDQNSKVLEIEGKINVTLRNIIKMMYYPIEPRDGIFVKSYGFLSSAKNMSKILVKIKVKT